MKHNNVAIMGLDLSRRWEDDNYPPLNDGWCVANSNGDLVGHDMDYASAVESARQMQEKEPDAEWEAIGGPDPTNWYLVMWPEHVLTPRYNGDCTVHGPFCSSDEALAYRDNTVVYHS